MAKRIQGSFEVVGDQGEKIPSHPIESADLIFINPINSEPFAFRYHWISSVQKSDSKFFGYFKSQKDITPTFEKILSTVKFTN